MNMNEIYIRWYSPHEFVDFRDWHASSLTVFQRQGNETRIAISGLWISIFFAFVGRCWVLTLLVFLSVWTWVGGGGRSGHLKNNIEERPNKKGFKRHLLVALLEMTPGARLVPTLLAFAKAADRLDWFVVAGCWTLAMASVNAENFVELKAN